MYNTAKLHTTTLKNTSEKTHGKGFKAHAGNIRKSKLNTHG